MSTRVARYVSRWEAQLREERPYLWDDDGRHWHVTKARDELDREAGSGAYICDDENCRHAGQFVRHARPCPEETHENCDVSLIHAVTCHCAACDPVGCALLPTWRERGDAEAAARRERLADAQENTRDRFLREQALERERQAARDS